MSPRAAAVGAAVALFACAAPGPVFVRAPETAELGLPFSDAVIAGDTVYVSGQIGNVPGSLDLVAGGIGPETRQALENTRAILERAGSGMDRVVKCTIFLADISEWASMNQVYVTFFDDPPPARSAIGVSGVAMAGRVELECIAMAGR